MSSWLQLGHAPYVLSSKKAFHSIELKLMDPLPSEKYTTGGRDDPRVGFFYDDLQFQQKKRKHNNQQPYTSLEIKSNRLNWFFTNDDEDHDESSWSTTGHVTST